MWFAAQESLPLAWRDSVVQWDRRQPALLTGSRGVFALAMLWIHTLTRVGAQVHVIDCAMRFHVQALVDESMRSQIWPEIILDQILVQRAFTPYQILDVIQSLSTAGDATLTANPPARIHCLLAPCKQFFDRDVGRAEGEFLLRKLFAIIRQISRQGTVLLLVDREEYKHPAWARLALEMRSLAAAHWHLSTNRYANPAELKLDYYIRSAENGKNSDALLHASGSYHRTITKAKTGIAQNGSGAP
ncbi:MAG: hypothetical protein KDK39_10555 [Leptospiraceae bacterium]|nr:hypothetical protein [Leptospiraceae bacterium]